MHHLPVKEELMVGLIYLHIGRLSPLFGDLKSHHQIHFPSLPCCCGIVDICSSAANNANNVLGWGGRLQSLSWKRIKGKQMFCFELCAFFCHSRFCLRISCAKLGKDGSWEVPDSDLPSATMNPLGSLRQATISQGLMA